MKIEIEIKNCRECPHFEKKRHWTEDSWEETYNWFCKKADNKKIEWHEDNDIKIPQWCPFNKEILTINKYKL